MKIKVAKEETEIKHHKRHIVCGIDVGSAPAMAIVDADLVVHEIASLQKWHIGEFYDLFEKITEKYVEAGYSIFVCIEVSPLRTFSGSGNVKSLHMGKLHGDMKCLVQLFEWFEHPVAEISPRHNPLLKIKRQPFDLANPKFGQATNEHERDAVGIAKHGMNNMYEHVMRLTNGI